MKTKQISSSVVLAVYNEAKNLAACLESVTAFADEIIVVDGHSTDETVAIAREHKAKVISVKNQSNFHINKQIAIDAAAGPLILQLDADEIVDAELASWIATIKRNPSSFADTSAWWIRRKNYFLDHWLHKGGQYPDPVIRLFWRGKAALPQKDVHEQMQVEGEVGWAEGHLNHYSAPTLSEYLRKMNTYSSFEAEKLRAHKVAPSFSLFIQDFLIRPVTTSCVLLFRHKGILDGPAGILFAILSGLHFPLQYLKLWELYER